eukprot:TRINITY_DN3416_c0_g1_i6.p1 TRINITY_DN3416_c0_g1~~TRINITY_DN3416_c0_g1_i6.p1  ORF type:complete len:754 (-),score=194.31 TRINITY_DN3416_c0_g1_i6:1541-3802(-)
MLSDSDELKDLSHFGASWDLFKTAHHHHHHHHHHDLFRTQSTNNLPDTGIAMGFMAFNENHNSNPGSARKKYVKVLAADWESLKEARNAAKFFREKSDDREKEIQQLQEWLIEERKRFKKETTAFEEEKKLWMVSTGVSHPSHFPPNANLQVSCAALYAQLGDVAALRRMLENGCDIYKGNFDNRTALHLAAAFGQLEVVEFLLSSGAPPDTVDAFGRTPFNEAVFNGHMKIALLIEFYTTQQLKQKLRNSLFEGTEYILYGREKEYLSRRKILNSLEIQDKEIRRSKDFMDDLKIQDLHRDSEVNDENPSSPKISKVQGHKTLSSGIKRVLLQIAKQKIGSHHSLQKIPSSLRTDELEDTDTLDTSKKSMVPFGIAFGILRGVCQVPDCNCKCYTDADRINGKHGICKCTHFPASHCNLGTSEQFLGNLNLIKSDETQQMLLPVDPDIQWPKKLNLKLFPCDVKILDQNNSEESSLWTIPPADILFCNEIGQGTTAKVYKGIWENSTVAIKVIDFQKNKEKLVNDIRKEFNMMKQLRSEHLVQLYGITVTPTICMVVEFCSKGSIFNFLKETPTLMSWPLVFKWFTQTIIGISILHSHNPVVVHRDIKTLNLLISEDDNIKVADFGLSRFIVEENLGSLKQLRGTYCYCAPEVYFGQKYTEKCDIYSLSIVLWELVQSCISKTYQLPYSEYTFLHFDFQVIIKSSKEDLRPTIPPTTPYSIHNLIETLWNPSPAVRPDIHTLLDTIKLIEKM